MFAGSNIAAYIGRHPAELLARPKFVMESQGLSVDTRGFGGMVRRVARSG